MKATQTISAAFGAVFLIAAGARAATLSFYSFDRTVEGLFQALLFAFLGALATHYALRNHSITK